MIGKDAQELQNNENDGLSDDSQESPERKPDPMRNVSGFKISKFDASGVSNGRQSVMS